MDGEKVLRKSGAFRRVLLLLPYSFGVLTLTTNRLIWTPVPFPWDLMSWTAMKDEVTKASLHRTSRWADPLTYMRWCVEIKARNRVHKFFAFRLFPPGYKAGAEKWVKVIQEWANLSA